MLTQMGQSPAHSKTLQAETKAAPAEAKKAKAGKAKK